MTSIHPQHIRVFGNLFIHLQNELIANLRFKSKMLSLKHLTQLKYMWNFNGELLQFI